MVAVEGVTDETRLFEKLARIEALFSGATTPGERDAAAAARQRILERLHSAERSDPPVEFRFSLADEWARRLFLALLRRYELKPYRYPGQRRTTVMVKVPKGFVHETLWPEYEQLSATLQSHLDEITNRVIAQVIHQDVSEASEVQETKVLGAGGPRKA